MKSDKSNPIKFFREQNENRAKVVKTSLKKMQLAGPVNEGTENVSKPTNSASEPTEAQRQAAARARAAQLATMSGKEYRQEKKGTKRAQKLERISSGRQGERVDNVIKAVGAGAEAISNVAGAVKGSREAFSPREQKRGGAVKRPKKNKNK